MAKILIRNCILLSFLNSTAFYKRLPIRSRAGEIAQWVKVPAAKSKELIPGPIDTWKLSSDFHRSACTLLHPCAYILISVIFFLKFQEK